MQRRIFLASAAGLVLASCAHTPPSNVGFTDIQKGGDPLRTAFNDDAGNVRLVLLVSPTCGFCLEGSLKVQNTILDHESSQTLTPFVVWVPQLGARRQHVASGAALVTDKRAQQYWDGTGWLGDAYQQTLGTPGSAWDVYMLYGRGVRWTEDLPPKPTYWMHQLSGVTSAPHLDPDILKQHTDLLLDAPT